MTGLHSPPSGLNAVYKGPSFRVKHISWEPCRARQIRKDDPPHVRQRRKCSLQSLSQFPRLNLLLFLEELGEW